MLGPEQIRQEREKKGRQEEGGRVRKEGDKKGRGEGRKERMRREGWRERKMDVETKKERRK